MQGKKKKEKGKTRMISPLKPGEGIINESREREEWGRGGAEINFQAGQVFVSLCLGLPSPLVIEPSWRYPDRNRCLFYEMFIVRPGQIQPFTIITDR